MKMKRMMKMITMIGIRITPSNRTYPGLIPLISLTILVLLVFLVFPVLKLRIPTRRCSNPGSRWKSGRALWMPTVTIWG